MRPAVIAALLAFAAGCETRTPTPGVACMFPVDCQAPLRCQLGRCRAPCTLDADCSTFLCLRGWCAVPQDEGCASMAGRGCSPQLTCAADRCTYACVDARDCASDGVCGPVGAAMVCSDPRAATGHDGG